MDSLKKFLKQKLQVPVWLNLHAFRKSSTVTRTGLCCLRLDPDGFSIAFVRYQGKTPALQWCKSIPGKPENFQSNLSAFVKKHKLEDMHCIWMLKSDAYKLLTLEEIPVLPEEFQAAVRFKIKSLLTFPIADAVVDHFSIPRPLISNAKKNMMVVVAQKSYLQPIVDAINDSGLQMESITIPELAYRNVTALFEKDDTSSALIYLRQKSSDVIVTRQKTFYLSRRIDWGIDLLINAATQTEKSELALDHLALEIQRSFDYYHSQWRQAVPSRVLLAQLQPTPIDIGAYLSQRLGVSMQNLDLTTVLSSQQPLTFDEQSQYLSIIGGMLYATN